MKRIAIFYCFFLMIFLIIVSCDSTKRDWKKANQFNTIEAFQEFQKKHPGSKYDSVAVRRIEEFCWEQAANKNTFEGFTKYLDNYSGSRYDSIAIGKLIEFTMNRVVKEKEFNWFEQYMNKYPKNLLLKDIWFKVSIGKYWCSPYDSNNTISFEGLEDKEVKIYFKNASFEGSIFLLDNGTWCPDNSEKYSITGSLETSLGNITKRAKLGAIDYVYSSWDKSRGSIISCVYCLTQGEVILPMNYFENGPSNKYVDNFFELKSFGEKWVIITIDPKKKHRLSLEIGDVGKYSLTQNYPKTVVQTTKGYFSRKSDGWYFTKNFPPIK